ncbi:hypothetical protein [Lactiplantibacillus pingfangensis]|uniref:hypothetical protein n=1 Tax=Lactiplantibacillus pingfangensis TaxID=2559915 RepID=UPI0010F69679|nr:hypothetical protein [Lactiplantibacillus pingfangensis]
MHLNRPVSFYRHFDFYLGLLIIYQALIRPADYHNLYIVGLSIPVLILGIFCLLRSFFSFPLINVRTADVTQRVTWLLPTAVGLLFLVFGQIGRVQQNPYWVMMTYVGALMLCTYSLILLAASVRTTVQRRGAPDNIASRWFFSYLVGLVIVSVVILLRLFMQA